MGIKEDYEARKRAEQAKIEARRSRVWWFKQAAPIDRFTGWLVAWTCMLFIATIGNAIILKHTDDKIGAQAKIAGRQLDAMEADQRPWLKVSIGVKQFFFQENKDVFIWLDIKLKNIGKSPARNIQSSFMLIPTNVENLLHSLMYEKKQCELAAAAAADPTQFRGHFLFPGEEDPLASRNIELAAKDYLPVLPSGATKVTFTVVGCYNYSFSGDETRHGHTGFSYGIIKAGGGDINFDIIPGAIPPNNMRVTKVPFSGGDVE
jgi:hypothetical protein